MLFYIPLGEYRHCNTVASPNRRHRIHDLQQETRAIFDRTSVGVCTSIAAILKKLVWQIAADLQPSPSSIDWNASGFKSDHPCASYRSTAGGSIFEGKTARKPGRFRPENGGT